MFTVFHGDSVKTDGSGLDNICSLVEDTEGGIWYGTIGNGLHRIIDEETGEMEKFQFETHPGFRNKFDSVVHIAIGPDSCLWVAG